MAQQGIGIRVEEYIAVVERRDKPDRLREEHAVAEHVTRHVADADHGEWRRLDIRSDLAEVTLDRLPRAARRDAHLLVVVSG